MSKTADLVTAIIEPIIEENGYDLVDVEFIKEGSDWFLRVYIDHEKGILIDDCVKASQLISAKLDEEDPIVQEYNLEVSSPGIERVIKKDKDFMRFIGSKIKIKLFTKYLDKKQHVGEIAGINEQSLTIHSDGETIEIPRELLSKVTLYWEN